MTLTTEELIRIAQWEPITAGFARSRSTIEQHIAPILDRIGVSADSLGSSLDKVAYSVLEDGGLTNYFAFFVFHPHGEVRRIGSQTGVTAYLSLLAPLGVVGRSDRVIDRVAGCSVVTTPHLELEDLVDPCDCEEPLIGIITNAISASHYRVLSPDEAKQPLPSGVLPYEYCLSREPWDRVFHVLFANTD